MLGEFDAATAVQRRDDGVYEGQVAPGWDIAGNANGGYLIALATRAMADAVDRPPLSVTAHYLAPGKPGTCEIDVDVLRAGRRMATVSAVVRGGETNVIALLGTFGAQGEPSASVVAAEPPDLPPIEGCVRQGPPTMANDSGLGDRIIGSYHPDDVGFRDGRPSGRALVRGWFEFADRQPIDAFGLLLAADAFAPVSFNRPEFPVGWAPTVELTVHIRGVPAPGPLRCTFSSRFMQTGMCEEDSEIWDSSGTLVAQSRQLALLPRG